MKERSYSFKLVVRELGDTATDPHFPELRREGTHVVRLSSGGQVLYETSTGCEPIDGLMGAFAAVIETVKEGLDAG